MLAFSLDSVTFSYVRRRRGERFASCGYGTYTRFMVSCVTYVALTKQHTYVLLERSPFLLRVNTIRTSQSRGRMRVRRGTDSAGDGISFLVYLFICLQVCPLAASQAIFILYTQYRPTANVGGPVVAEEIILCGFKKALYSVLLYCECARLCLCDGRTHGQTHNPILSGIRFFATRRHTTAKFTYVQTRKKEETPCVLSSKTTFYYTTQSTSKKHYQFSVFR